MEHTLGIGWRFFKIMFPGFDTKLQLPPTVCKILGKVNLEEVVLITKKGSWKIAIQESEQESLCFTDGWADFVRENNLVLGDFAVFEHFGALQFNVILFGHTCLEKDFNFKPETSSRSSRSVRGKKSDIRQGKSWFTITIKSYNLRGKSIALNIPQKFRRSNGLEESTDITLRGPCGKTWPAEIRIRGANRNYKVAWIIGGWKEFSRYYKLKVRDVCTFSVIPHHASFSLDMKLHNKCVL